MSKRPKQLIIGCVGKPSAGKSTFLNSVTEANAAVGDYPFTTIEPNEGLAMYTVPCPCLLYDVTDSCDPQFGSCKNGERNIPVKVLDVAGLVPGAHTGRGIGNKFLDDLRHAHILLHVVDVSGTTDENGRATLGYNPVQDIQWLEDEIMLWIYNNLINKWGSVLRKWKAQGKAISKYLQEKLSGYGCKRSTIQKAMDKLKLTDNGILTDWDDDMIKMFCVEFVRIRFPTILVLNKIDMKDSHKNIGKICEKYEDDKMVLCSGLIECYLKKLRKEGYIKYDGLETIITSNDEDNSELIPLSKKEYKRVERIRNKILLPYGATGVHDAIQKAVELKNYFPVYMVENINSFEDASGHVFGDSLLIPPNTTVGSLMSRKQLDVFWKVQLPNSQPMGVDSIITPDRNILKFTYRGAVEEDSY
eukprot:TRINITY_DN640_c0_g1_i1.p1 TRINITY_DN640_c0_g1~~TRINITY_DN640_c0_g1_i1.p1  ORF type:complete len:417 (-),score=84.12 TRINITY_DN640_c0_g1_i1:1763-3013(-)